MYLLLQFRPEPEVAKEEHETFARVAGISSDLIATRNYCSENFSLSPIDLSPDYLGIFIGGSSTISTLDKESSSLLQLAISDMKVIIERSIPTLASCFGFQLAAVILGGAIERNKDQVEGNSLCVTLTEEGRQDELLEIIGQTDALKKTGNIITFHQEGIRELPEGTIRLLEKNYWEQGFRIRGKPFWAFQGHPELDSKALAERLWIYKENYGVSEEEYSAILKKFHESHEMNAILSRFTEICHQLVAF